MIHKLADVQSQNIGENTNIWQFCVILKNAKIGSNCNINASVLVENDVIIGNNVTFTNDLMSRTKQYPKAFFKTSIKKLASIRSNSTIIGGITIGEYAIESVVTKDVWTQELWYGNPVKHRGYVCKCGQKCDETLICSDCKIGGVNNYVCLMAV